MNRQLKMGGACCDPKGQAPKNTLTKMVCKGGSAAPIKNAVAMKPKAKGYSKIKGAISG